MSINCIHCVVNDRTGIDLLCDECRTINRISAMSLQQCGKLLLIVAQAVLDKQHNYSPHGSLLMRVAKNDGTLTVCLARDDAAPMLATAMMHSRNTWECATNPPTQKELNEQSQTPHRRELLPPLRCRHADVRRAG